jgi:hypothetical protein
MSGSELYARIVRILSEMPDALEAAELSREVAAKLSFGATQLWIESRRLAAARRGRN